MRKTRTFVAVELSPAVRQRACDLIERFKASDTRVTWVVPENMHLTLKFLGEQTDSELVDICRAVQAAVKPLPRFEFRCHGAGAFPSCQRPRTLWIGVEQGADALKQLHQHVEEALAKLGYPKENRDFQPHLTVGRVRSGGPAVEILGQLVQKAEDFQVGTVQTSEVVVYGSFLQRGGPRYEVLARAALEG
jgi:2'-5' RNA ligase